LENEDMLCSYQMAMVGKHVMMPDEEIEWVKEARFSLESREDTMKKDNMCFEDTSVTYHDYEDK
jgi:hypothetical protein